MVKRGGARKICRVAIKQRGEDSMTRHIRNFAGLAVLLTAISAHGQVGQQARVTVPFSFVAGGKSSPPGDYRLNISRDGNLATLSTADASGIMFLTYGAWQGQGTKTYLRFHRYGERWFLEQVAISGLTRDVMVDKRVKEVFTASTQGAGGPVSSDVAVH